MKLNISNLVDMRELARTKLILDSAGGTQNSAISGRSMIALTAEVLASIPSDVTFMDLGIQESNVGGWGDYIESLRLVGTGSYRRTGDTANTTGEISLGGESSMIKVIGHEASSHFSLTQRMKAKISGINLLGELHNLHTIKYFESIDELMYSGIIGGGYDRVESVKLWKDMNDNEQLTYIFNLLKKQRAGRSRKFWANKLVVDDEMWNDITTTDYSTLKDGTIEEKVMKTFKVSISSSWRLKKAGTGGARTMVALCNAPYSIKNRIPIKLKISPATTDGFKTRFDGLFRVAGADILDYGGGLIGDKL